ncbi:MAG: ankyrin repeat domain-containing protein, partial [Chlamydiae bacterium]|nr:ankyrin repeat domain-containing protein [Chlamydiota bacterium]
MAISREAARHNLQMIADGETLHVGEDGLLHIGGGNQARVQGVVNQTLAYNSLRYVNTGHLQERIQSVTGHVFDITPAELNSELFGEDFKREVRVAFEAGNLELLRFLLPQGRELSVESLNGAVMAASKNGHLEVVRFLLSRGRELSVKSLDLAVCGASGNGHLDVVRFLLSEGRELSVESLDRVVWVASGNGHLDVVRFLLPEGRELSQSSRNHAVWMASDDGHLDVVRFLLPQGQELSQKILDSVVYGASGNGHLDVVRFLLSEGRELSQEVLNNAVAGAFENGYLEVLLFLLSQGTVGINSRNGIALRASSDGHPDILETVLRNGPIYQSTLGSCRTQATAGENRQRILDLLDSAPVIPDPSRDGSAPSIAGSTSLTLSDVKEHPQVYLDRLAADGVPRRVSLLDNPKAVDLGGVTRQYLTTLFGALLEKGAIRVNDEGTPSAEQDQDKEVLQKVGQVFSHLVKRNRTRTDKFLVG